MKRRPRSRGRLVVRFCGSAVQANGTAQHQDGKQRVQHLGHLLLSQNHCAGSALDASGAAQQDHEQQRVQCAHLRGTSFSLEDDSIIPQPRENNIQYLAGFFRESSRSWESGAAGFITSCALGKKGGSYGG